MAFTKVLGPGIHTQANIHSHNINSSGIITATKFVGPITGGGGDFNAGIVTCTTLDVNGNADISGNLVVHGDTTTLNTTLREVELLHVDANSSVAAGIITQTGAGDILNLFDGTTEVFTVLDTGEVGIGTVTPARDLHVLNTTPYIRIESDAANQPATLELYHTRGNGSDHWPTSVATDDAALTFNVASAANGSPVEKVRIDSAGKVGIGTVTPGDLVHINTTGNVGGLRFGNAQNLNAGTIRSNWNSIDLIADQNLTFQTNSNTRMKITNGGLVGIGTDAGYGDATLTVHGTAALTNNDTTLQIKDNVSDDAVGRGGNIGFGAYVNGTMRTLAGIGALKTNAGNSFSGDLALYTRVNGQGSLEERLRITSAGKIGIGETSPDELLHIASTGTAKFRLTDNRTSISDGSQYGVIQFEQRDSNTPGVSAEVAAVMQDTTNGNTSIQFRTGTPSTIDERVRITGSGNLKLPDSAKIELGGAQTGAGDLSIYHDTSDSKIVTSTGDMWLQSTADDVIVRAADNISLQVQGGEYGIDIAGNAAVQLFYDASVHTTAKLATTATGVSVHGEVAASQDYPNIRPTLDLNFAATKKLDPRITFYRDKIGSYIDENGDYRWASENEPRFDHDEVTHESEGLLMEVARTNKLSSGNNIPSGSNSGGSPGPSLVANNVEAPDGSPTARTVDYSNASGNMNSANIEFAGWDSDPSGKTYSASIWVKGTQGHTINFYLDASGQGSSATGKGNFTLTGKWQRLSVYHTYPSGSNAAYLRCGTRNLQTGVEGTATVVSFWGTTIVEESRPGSTIATPIVATTTAADYALIDGEEFSEFYSPLEHTTVMIGKRAANVAGADGRLYTISNGTSSQVAPDWDFDDGTKLRFSTNVGGSTQTLQTINSWSGINDEFKIAAGIALNNQIGVVNGTAIAAADTSCAIPTGVDRLYFGLRGDGGNQGSLTIKRFMFYPKRLPDSQLVTLTS